MKTVSKPIINYFCGTYAAAKTYPKQKFLLRITLNIDSSKTDDSRLLCLIGMGINMEIWSDFQSTIRKDIMALGDIPPENKPTPLPKVLTGIRKYHQMSFLGSTITSEAELSFQCRGSKNKLVIPPRHNLGFGDQFQPIERFQVGGCC
jgi:hypothetical protein